MIINIEIRSLELIGSSERMAHGFGKRTMNSTIYEPAVADKDEDYDKSCMIFI